MAVLSDLIGNTAAIRAYLQRALGFPNDTVLLPDATVDDAMTAALMRVNADFPEAKVGSFTTVADQQAYTPLPATAYGFRRVYWPVDPLCANDYRRLRAELDPLLNYPIDEHGTRLATDPSAAMMAVRRASWLRKFEARGVEFLDETVYLDPVPSQTGDAVYFTYNDKRYTDSADVHEKYVPALLKFAEHKLHERAAGGAGSVEVVRDTAEGTDIRLRGPQYHAEMRDKTLAEYHGMKPPIPTRVWP